MQGVVRSLNNHFTVNLLEEFRKSAKICQNYGHESVMQFLAHPVCACFTRPIARMSLILSLVLSSWAVVGTS